ncbi:uncharacterized protein APUU_50187S [Aspergillus puulaauensis]|uniref:VOC domain-containing protein n=1 Tax=Aspergillus puulaauensis TaxID=1220207 RepID=A0A7R7XPT1_9EURO|nr:uncharacterized protein APUU_50187S [Aspergillus puulaauensis]BCS25476.1 hypothetical protein APUU_50187S [Aspergillus puulaauensis]
MTNQTTNTAVKPITPKAMVHFGLYTTPDKYEEMVKWHLNFFGGTLVLKNEFAAFIAYDDEHHRMVIVSDANHKRPEDRKSAVGIFHIAFTLDTLADLATSYEQRKALGIEPFWPVNHGMSTSMYYYDPDHNEFELQVDNFDTTEAARQFMASEEYANNPIGVDINVDEWLRRVRSGEDEKSIKARPVIGRRHTRPENSIYFSPIEIAAK